MAVSPPPAAMLTYVTFQSRTSTRPIEHSATWAELAAQLTQHARRPGKDGPGWSPAIYKRDKREALLTRANASVEALTCAVADVDHIGLDDVVTLREYIRELGLAGVIYSTHSSTETEPRIRVVVPLAEPAPAELWPRLWPTLAERIFLGLADTAASDAARLYYLPSAPTDALTIADRWEGAALDWHTLPLAEERPIATPSTVAGAGPVATVAPDDMPILERLFSGRRAEQRMKAFLGDYSDFGGDASAADQSVANGLVVYCRGDVERAERIMRAGAWRPKWDAPRGSTTVLGMTLGKALAAYQAWANRPALEAQSETLTDVDWLDEWPSDDTVSVSESPEQMIARVQQENAQLRATHAVQMAALRSERDKRQAAEATASEAKETVQLIRDVIAWTGAEPPQKMVILCTLFEAHSRASRDIDTLTNARLVEMTALKENKVSACAQDFSAREGSPIRRWNDREWVKLEPGAPPEPRTHTYFRLAHPTLNDSLRAVVSMGPPSPKAQKATEDARERARKNRQSWGECPEGDCPEVHVIGSCHRHPTQIVGDRVMTRDEFKLLDPHATEFVTWAGSQPSVTGGLTKDHGIRDVGDAATQLALPDERRHELRDAEPPNIGRIRAQRAIVAAGQVDSPAHAPEVSGPRCGADKPSGRTCISTLYRDLGAGIRKCRGCGAVAIEVPAMAGGSE